MAKTQKTMHTSAVVLFLIATVFYFLGFATPVYVFGAIGFVVEIAAWITLFTSLSKTKRSSESEG